jgi:NDP-sugar pyrophosphorylase family protein
VILAGGLATRLRPLTDLLPKAMVDVNGDPFIVHQLRLLGANGIDNVVVCLGHLGERVVEYVGDGGPYGVNVRYSFDGPRLLGTAGAVKHALPLLGESFFVLYGDSYLPCNYRRVQSGFEAAGRPALMTVFRNDNRWDHSNVEFGEGRIVAYDKSRRTEHMQHIDYGLGVFQASAFDGAPPGKPCDLATLYQRLLSDGQLAGLEVGERFYEIGSPAGLAETRGYLASRVSRNGPDSR